MTDLQPPRCARSETGRWPFVTEEARSRRAPRAFAHSGIWISPVREKVRSSIIETPLPDSRVRPTSILYVSSAQPITAAAGSASYGYQIAAAAPEVVP